MLAIPSRDRGLFRKDCFGATPKARAGLYMRDASATLDQVDTLLTINNMQRPFLHRECGFFDGFAQGRMRMTGPAEVFAAATEFDN